MHPRMLKALALLLALLAGVSLATLFVIDTWVSARAGGRIYTHAEEMSKYRVGLVLGTSPRISNGETNLYYRYRMQAAAELWHAGKVQALLVSGDNRRNSYNEPREMVRSLVALGVPAAAIGSDYAGIRTLDSVVRAKEVFGLHEVVIISQTFHVERALFLADSFGLDAVAFAAAEVVGPKSWPVQARELLARSKMMLDILIGVGPRHLGPPVALPSPLEISR